MNAINKKRKSHFREASDAWLRDGVSVQPYTHGYFARRDAGESFITFMSRQISDKMDAVAALVLGSRREDDRVKRRQSLIAMRSLRLHAKRSRLPA